MRGLTQQNATRLATYHAGPSAIAALHDYTPAEVQRAIRNLTSQEIAVLKAWAAAETDDTTLLHAHVEAATTATYFQATRRLCEVGVAAPYGLKVRLTRLGVAVAERA